MVADPVDVAMRKDKSAYRASRRGQRRQIFTSFRPLIMIDSANRHILRPCLGTEGIEVAEAVKINPSGDMDSLLRHATVSREMHSMSTPITPVESS